MENSFSCLHPNPGWGKSPKTPEDYYIGPSNKDIIGKHCILELYECDTGKLNDEAFIRTTLTTAAKSAGATLINLITHHFEPQGVTGLALLAESHISIHTWPESGYAAVDVFTCGDHTMPERACKFLGDELSAKKHSLRTLERETLSTLTNNLREPIIKN